MQLHALAYSLGNFMATPALPRAIRHRLLTTLGEKPVKIGEKMVRHDRYINPRL